MLADNVHPRPLDPIGSTEFILHPHDNLHKQINPLFPCFWWGDGGRTILFLTPERKEPPPPEATKVLSSCHWRAKTGKSTAVVLFTTGASAEDIEGGGRETELGHAGTYDDPVDHSLAVKLSQPRFPSRPNPTCRPQ